MILFLLSIQQYTRTPLFEILPNSVGLDWVGKYQGIFLILYTSEYVRKRTNDIITWPQATKIQRKMFRRNNKTGFESQPNKQGVVRVVILTLH